MPKLNNARAVKVDMVGEKPMKAIALFAIPLLLGNLLQQLYNTVDSIVVGRLVGSAALAAVGASSPVLQLMLALFSGIATGASIAVSNATGDGDTARLERIVYTVLALALLAGVVVGALGYAATPLLLQGFNTPPEVFDMARDYMSISLAGVVNIMLFNVLNGVLQGMGDARSPLLILMVCSVMNVALDLLFVAVLGMSVAGVAWATMLSQALSAVIGMLKLSRADANMRLRLRALRISPPELNDILRIGVPAGLQRSLNAVGNLLVQGVLNGFGAVVMAANIAVIKLDSFCVLPMMTFASVITVFTGQNCGARRMDRVRRGARATLAMSLGMSACISLLLVAFGSEALRLFTSDADVIRAGMDKIRIIAPFYFCMGITGVLAGVIRGSGSTLPPMLIGVLCMFVGRVPVAFLLSRAIGANGVHWSLSVQWSVEALLISLYYLLVFRKKLSRG